jgi:GNAT superfamily N-acetyltransferase
MVKDWDCMMKCTLSSNRPPLRVDARFSMTVPLRGASTLVVRCIRPDDKPALREGFKYLSAETRYRRFHAAVTDLSPAMLRYLTEVDGWNHVAVVAIAPRSRGSRARVVGVARAIRLAEDERAAEIALAVADDVQRRGLGGLLLEILVNAARERGIANLRAHVHYDDRTVRDLLLPHGAVLDWVESGMRTIELQLRSTADARALDS